MIMRILAATCVATTGAVEPECVKSIWRQELPEGVELDWDFERGHQVFVERNELVRRALDGGYDRIFFVDSDVKLPEGAVKNLLDPEEPIVMGFVPLKNTRTEKTSVYKHGKFFDKRNCYITYELDIMDGRVCVKGGGFGCVMIDTDVFREIEPPWFVYSENKNGIRKGEDISFCYKAAEHGYDIKADPRVLCKHKRSDWQ